MNRRSFLKTSILPIFGVQLNSNSDKLPSIEDPSIGSVTVSESTIHRRLGYFPLYTGDSLYPTSVEVPVDTYLNHKNESRSFIEYFNTLQDDDLIQDITDQMLPPVSIDKYLNAFTMITRREEYRKEYKDSSRLVYTRHPIETVIEGRGDCVDKSLLLYSVLANLDYDVGYALLPNHLSVIVQRDAIESEIYEGAIKDNWISVNGVDYGYIEVVNTNKINDPLGDDTKLGDIYFVDTISDGFELKNIKSIPNHISGTIDIFLDRLLK